MGMGRCSFVARDDKSIGGMSLASSSGSDQRRDLLTELVIDVEDVECRLITVLLSQVSINMPPTRLRYVPWLCQLWLKERKREGSVGSKYHRSYLDGAPR